MYKNEQTYSEEYHGCKIEIIAYENEEKPGEFHARYSITGLPAHGYHKTISNVYSSFEIAIKYAFYEARIYVDDQKN
jgi:hypothetical protein